MSAPLRAALDALFTLYLLLVMVLSLPYMLAAWFLHVLIPPHRKEGNK